MAILTRAELDHYPGNNATERELAHLAESPPKRLRLGERPGHRHEKPAPVVPAPLDTLPARLDLRPFPGRDRTERIMAWLIAHVPRAELWSTESLRELAARIQSTRDLLE